MLAWWRLLSLSGYDACWVQNSRRAPGGKYGRKKHETSHSPLSVLLVSKHSLWRFWGCLVWHLWIERVRHLGPEINSIVVEVFNAGGWLTNGDFALDAAVDFLGVTEHRLIPARVRNVWSRLRGKGMHSFWAPASQESSHVGNAGVGVVSLKDAPLAMPRFGAYYLLGLRDSCTWWSCMVTRVLIPLLSSFGLLISYLLLLSTWSPRRYLLWPKVSPLGWRLAGLLRMVGSLQFLELLVSALVLLTLEIGGIFRLDALCVLLF